MKSLEKNHHLTFYPSETTSDSSAAVAWATKHSLKQPKYAKSSFCIQDRQAYIHAPQLIIVCKSGTGLESGGADIATAKRYVRWQIWDSTGRREMYVYAYGWHACAANISILHHLPDP